MIGIRKSHIYSLQGFMLYEKARPVYSWSCKVLCINSINTMFCILHLFFITLNYWLWLSWGISQIHQSLQNKLSFPDSEHKLTQYKCIDDNINFLQVIWCDHRGGNLSEHLNTMGSGYISTGTYCVWKPIIFKSHLHNSWIDQFETILVLKWVGGCVLRCDINIVTPVMESSLSSAWLAPGRSHRWHWGFLRWKQAKHQVIFFTSELV